MYRRLHIGGQHKTDGWETLNIQDGGDYVGDAKVLDFDDETFELIYASHVLEHVDQEPAKTLKEWYRVLQYGGVLYVSVPDMKYLCKLFLSAKDPRDRVKILQMIYGGHVDKYDYHIMGFDEEILRSQLRIAGFASLERVSEFGYFEDCSKLKVNGRLLSLNMKAHKGASNATSYY